MGWIERRAGSRMRVPLSAVVRVWRPSLPLE
jgi:hypothetical protein